MSLRLGLMSFGSILSFLLFCGVAHAAPDIVGEPNLKLTLLSDCRLRSKPKVSDESEFLSLSKSVGDVSVKPVDTYWVDFDISSLQSPWVNSKCLQSRAQASAAFSCQLFSSPDLAGKTSFYLTSRKFEILETVSGWSRLKLAQKNAYLGVRCFGQPLMYSEEFYSNLAKICESGITPAPPVCAYRIAKPVEPQVAEKKEEIAPASAAGRAEVVSQRPGRAEGSSALEVYLQSGFWDFDQTGLATLSFARVAGLGFGGIVSLAIDPKSGFEFEFSRKVVRVPDLAATFGKTESSMSYKRAINFLPEQLKLRAQFYSSDMPVLISGVCVNSCATYSAVGAGVGIGYEFQLPILPQSVRHEISALLRYPFYTNQSVDLQSAFEGKIDAASFVALNPQFDVVVRLDFEMLQRTLNFPSNRVSAEQRSTFSSVSLGARYEFD